LFCGARRAVFTPKSPRIPAAELEPARRRVAPRYFSKRDRDELLDDAKHDYYILLAVTHD